MKRFIKWLIRDWWVVRRCYFPYPEGYATYNTFRKTVLDTGLSKIEAEKTCNELNKEVN